MDGSVSHTSAVSLSTMYSLSGRQRSYDQAKMVLELLRVIVIGHGVTGHTPFPFHSP